jgi:hypothetical protein
MTLPCRVIQANPDPRPRDDRPLSRPPARRARQPIRRRLGLRGKAGIVDVGVVAVDGTKLATSASAEAIRTYERISPKSSPRPGARTGFCPATHNLLKLLRHTLAAATA